MRIALAQLNHRIADFPAIRQSLLDAAEKAVAAGADLIVYPELATIGYPPRDLLHRRSVIEAQWLLVKELAECLPLPAILGCIEPLLEGSGPLLANAAVYIADGQIQASYHKCLLPTYDVFDERRYFRPGDQPCIVKCGDKRIGITICEDIWTEDFSGIRYHRDPVGELKGNCDILVNVSASPYSMDKPYTRQNVVASAARRLDVPVVYVNQVGGQDELLFDGGSCVVRPDGKCCALGKRWEEDLVIAEQTESSVSAPTYDRIGDVYNALVQGIRDYCDKTGQQGVVLGLSGGIDSALVAALAVDALGGDRVHGLLMPGPYSSQGSVDDARALAENFGMPYFVCPIADGYEAVVNALAEPFAGTQENVAEENIQARLRGNLVMAYANKFNLMALTTGNKSELAVGYCTIYGDMNGGLAPLGDVYKSLVWDLSRYANRNGERIPENSITKPPSAELRPDQLDSDSLPPYEELDRILHAFIEENLSGDTQKSRGENPAVVDRILRLVDINEYKRWQAAPVLRVTNKAFGVGRRIPLARGIG